MRIRVNRHHDFSCGHRIYGHKGGCGNLHGHNYRAHFYCEQDRLDALGMVVDFAVIKSRLCAWVEENWDHRFLLWAKDPAAPALQTIDPTIVLLPFNPTAENMALHLLETVGPKAMAETGVRLVRVVMEETRKCLADCALD